MRKLDKYQIIGIIGIIVVLLSMTWFVNGGMQKVVEHNQKQLEQIIDNM